MSRPIPEDQLLTQEHAAEIFLGDRRRVSTLRAEAVRGNLTISKIGRSYWTTLARMKEMDEKCWILDALAKPLIIMEVNLSQDAAVQFSFTGSVTRWLPRGNPWLTKPLLCCHPIWWSPGAVRFLRCWPVWPSMSWQARRIVCRS